MLILFDHGTPKGLARALLGHTIITAQARGWDKLNNGALLDVQRKRQLIYRSRPTGESATSRILPDEKLICFCIEDLILINGEFCDGRVQAGGMSLGWIL